MPQLHTRLGSAAICTSVIQKVNEKDSSFFSHISLNMYTWIKVSYKLKFNRHLYFIFTVTDYKVEKIMQTLKMFAAKAVTGCS